MTDDADELEPVGDDFWAPDDDGATDGDADSVVLGQRVEDSTDTESRPPVDDTGDGTEDDDLGDADLDHDVDDEDAEIEDLTAASPVEEHEEDDADACAHAGEAADDDEDLGDDEVEEPAPAFRLDPVSRWLLGVSFGLIVVLLVTTGAMLYYLTTLNHAPRTAIEREVVVWETAVVERPGDAQAWGQLAYAYAAAERWGDALDTVDRGIKTTDQKALVVVEADILRFAGRYTEARAAYDRAETEIKNLVARVKEEQQKKGVYVEQTDQSLTGVFYGRALTRYELGDLDGAIEDVKKAIALAPEQASMSVTLGEYYLEAGEKQKAREMFTAALKYIPDYQEALDGLQRAGGADNSGQ